MQSFDQRTREYRAYIDDYLSRFYDQWVDEPQKILYDSMRYSLLAGGKRLRPIFSFEFCRICGRDWKEAAPWRLLLR